MKPTHFRPHVERNPPSFSDDPFDPWRLRTSRAGESRSPRTVGNLPAKRSASQDSTNGPTILGLSAESLEGVEVGFGDCPARDRAGLAKEAFQTLLVPIIAAQESRPASDQRRYSKTGEDNDRSQCGLGRTANSWGTAQAGNRGFRTYSVQADAETEHHAVSDVANLPRQSRTRPRVDRLLHRADGQIARVVCVHCFVARTPSSPSL